MDFLLNFASWFKGLPASGKVSLFLVVVGAFTAAILLRTEIKTAGYQYLYTNLSMTDADSIAARLQNMNVDAQVRGSSILVPANKVLELRNSLAAEGLPRGGGTGFEIFDKKNFGATEFEQRVNYIRAVQGELSRTISAIDGVDKARVHIVMPEKRLFEEDNEEPRASVALTLYKGRSLSPSQVAGITHLIITSVEGMTEANISVIDQNGNVLFKGSGQDGPGSTQKNIEMQRDFEDRMEKRITAMLEKIVGPGGVAVRVSAEMDFQMVEKTVESYDPEGRVVKNETIISDTSEGSRGGAAGGAPGTASNLGEGGAAAGGGSTEKSERVENNNVYALSKTIQKVLEPSGEVKRLTVAVLVDGKYRVAEATEGEEAPAPTYEPRSAEEIQKIDDLVKKSIGFNADRGDEVKVENMQFKRIGDDLPGQEAFVEATNSARMTMFLMDNAKIIGIVLISGIIFFMLVKLINSYAPPMEVAYANIVGEKAGEVGNALPSGAQVQLTQRDDEAARQKAEALAEKTPDLQLQKGPEIQFREAEQQSVVVETPMTSEEKLRLQAAKMQAQQIVENNPDEAVQVVRSWMAED